MLDDANHPIYEGCRKCPSKFFLTGRMINIKTDNNLLEVCMNAFAKLFKEYLQKDNLFVES